MKKKLLFVLLLVLIICSYVYINKDNDNKKLDKKENVVKKDSYEDKLREIKFYKSKNKKRYLDYHENNKELSIKNVVIRVNLNLDKEYYTDTVKTPYQNNTKILVNKYIYMDSDYVPDNLENLDTSYSRSGMKLVNVAKTNLEKMVEAIRKDGLNIRVMSSYRSYKYQVDLYNRYVNTDGKEAADTYSARPGFSEHQTGLCMDIDDGKINYTDFEKSKSFEWMQDNAYKYGFILRYPDDKTDITGYTYESWHYRYVGVKIATYIKKHNISFDEYYAMFLDN